MSLRYTIPIDELDASQAPLAGGKGASLGELVRSGVRVPAGFVVTRLAFDQFVSAADPDERVRKLLNEVKKEQLSLSEASRSIHELLGHARIPVPISSAIACASDALAVERVSVRSSATCEDGTATAWAGQLQTYLDVPPEEVESQIRACWLSIFREAALAYGAAHGYGVGEFGVAVVVQQMVSSEVSGIGFSVHPVTQEPDLRLIEACFGQGEAIVSGNIVPDQFIIRRGAKEIVQVTHAQQRRALFLDHQKRAPQWQELGPRGSEPKLTNAQALEYARLLDQIEDHYGHPVDTEWALTGDVFHLLQARPITTLAKEYREPIVDRSEPWSRIVRRPLTLFETSLIGLWQDSRHAGRDFGIHIDRFLAIQDAADLVSMFLPTPSLEVSLEHIRDLDRNDRPRLLSHLQRGMEVYDEGLKRIQSGVPFRSLDEAAEHFIEVGRFTTSFPASTLIALDEGGIDDLAIRAAAEELRSRSLYPRYMRKLVDPLVEAAAAGIGFSEPTLAPDLMSWYELRDNRITRETLEERRELVHAGCRFVLQISGDIDRVQFVSETGYLIMRELGQREIVPPDDPDRVAGHAAWPGVHRGRARVLLTSEPDGIEIQDGDVLVSIQSNPTLMPLLRHAGAIVTDDGGVACHAGIICRELKIPTIIGTGRATSVIHDGDFVEVDAMDQVVRVLERAAT